MGISWAQDRDYEKMKEYENMKGLFLITQYKNGIFVRRIKINRLGIHTYSISLEVCE